MEIAYLMAGKRIRARNVADLNSQLAQYKLVSNLSDEGLGSLSARRTSEALGTPRYHLTQSIGDSADISGYDVIVGRHIESEEDVIETDISDLQAILNEVRQDISDAKIIAGSYWF